MIRQSVKMSVYLLLIRKNTSISNTLINSGDLEHLYGLLDGKTAFFMKLLISWETQNVV